MHFLSRRQFLRQAMAAAGCLGWGLAGRAAGATDAPAPAEKSIWVAAINDLHVTNDAASTALVDRAVAQINADARIEFVAAIGDMVGSATEQSIANAKTALDKLRPPWKALPGNHDVAMNAPDIFSRFTQAFGPVHWRQDLGDWTLIGYNTCVKTDSDVTVGAGELAWLKEQAAGVPVERPIALFGHHPLNPNAQRYRIANAGEILAVFAGHKLRLAAAGHWHGNQEETRDGVLFTTTACCSSTRENFDKTPQKGYRLFCLGGDRVSTEFVEVKNG